MKAKRNFSTDGIVAVKPILRRSRFVFNSIKKILPIIVVFSCLFAVACNGSKPTGDGGQGDVVAKVGSKEITLKQVDTVIKQQLDQSPGTTFTPAELAAARLSVLDNLIREEAFFQKAQKDKLEPDENKVTQELQKKKQDAGLTEEQYQAQLKQAGLTEEEYKNKIRHDLAITALQEKERARVNPPSDEEVKKYYEDHKAEFKAVRGADLSIISVSPANNGGEAGAETKIKAIYAQLKSGSDFATIASQRSEDPSNMRGGNMGFLTEEQLKQGFSGKPEIVQRIMTSMSNGEITEPINQGGSWAVFKLNARREKEENLVFENPDVRKTIVDTITQQRQQVLMTALLMVALSESNAKNFLAERIVENPKSIVEMKPSALLSAAPQTQQAQPQPRVENQNQAAPAANANRPAAANANSAKPATANSNQK
jgi:parvulin-like peptidyl-prolyl isomerase